MQKNYGRNELYYILISRKNYTHVIYKRLKYKEFMDSSMCIILKNHYFLYTCFAR